jgi:mannosyltransferase
MLNDKKFINKYLFLIPYLFVVVNFFLKENCLEFQNIAGDETFSIYYAQLNPSEIIHFLSQGNNPPFFELILHYWIKFFGISDYSVRVIPLIFSSLSVFFLYEIAYKFLNLKTAILAATLFTFSNFEMYFAHEVRVYALFLFLTLVSFYSFLNLIQDFKSKKYIVIFVLANSILLYSHYFGFFVLFVQFISIFLLTEKNFKKKLNYMILLIIPLVLFIPFLKVLISNYITTSSNGSWVPFSKDLGQINHFIYTLINSSSTVFIVFSCITWLIVQYFIVRLEISKWLKQLILFFSIVFLFFSLSIFGGIPHYWEYTSENYAIISYLIFILIICYLILKSSKINRYSKIILIWFFLPLLLIYLFSFKTPMFLERYLIFISPGFYLLVAYALYQFEKFNNYKLSYLIIFAMFITSTKNVDKKHQILDMTNKVKELKTDSSLVYLAPSYYDINFVYYYNKEIFKQINLKTNKQNEYKSELLKSLNKENIHVINFSGEIDTLKLKQNKRIIFIDIASEFAFPNNNILNFLQENLILDSLYTFPEHYKVYQFSKKK